MIFFVAEPDEHHPDPEDVHWAEALRVSFDIRDGRHWLLIEPNIWIWPSRAREQATDFMQARRKDRLNRKHNAILDAWIPIVLGVSGKDASAKVSAYGAGSAAENPEFQIRARTAYAFGGAT